jgi:hypothetical protein
MRYFLTISLVLVFFKSNSQIIGPEYQQIFDNIVRLTQVEKQHIKLKLNENGNSFFTEKEDSTWVISIGIDRLKYLPKNLFTVVVCHEIGHVIKKHQGERNFWQEQESDSTCGYWMRYLNYEVSDFIPYLAYFLTGEPRSYGTDQDRIYAFLRGWREADKIYLKLEYASNIPRITWSMEANRNLSVKVNNREIIYLDGNYYNHGLVYDSLTNSTFELMDWPERPEGIGRFITNKTQFTYRVYKNGDFSLYNMGDEMRLEDCKKAGTLRWEGENGVFGPCDDDFALKDLEFVFVDCDLVPYNYAMPAESRRSPKK